MSLPNPETTKAEPAATSAPPKQPGLTVRAFVVSVILTILAGFWVRQSEIVALATQVSESVPAIPGLAALTLLLVVNFILRRVRKKWTFNRAELLTIFLFVTLSSTVMGVGITQFMFSLITAPFYYKTDGIDKNAPFLPKWLVVSDEAAIKQLYERNPVDGSVPWNLWLQPMGLWILFFLALWCTLYCLMALFYRIWNEEERLSFPQVFIPMEMTGGDGSTTPFFKNRLMWAGFAVAAIYNFVNIAHALVPSIPAFGKNFDLAPLLTVHPWKELAPLKIEFRPELIGLGYLVSTEISLTAWLTFVLMKLVAVAGASYGYPPGQLPYAQEQGIGAYLTLAVLMVVLSRRSIGRILQLAWKGEKRSGAEGLTARQMVCGFLCGAVFVWAFMTLAGMAYWVSFVYLVLVLAVAMVYGRLRAEAGVPLVWLFPFYMQKRSLLYAFGSIPFQSASLTTVPVWALFTFLSRGYFPQITGYQLESMELGRRVGIRPKRLMLAITLAVGLGLLVGWYNHLTPYYERGAVNLRGGIWGEWISKPEYTAAARYPVTSLKPEEPRIWAMGTGGFTAFSLWWLRLQIPSFPFHPLGYVMACSYGGLIWSSFIIVWVLKSMALRYGGMRFYRQTIPFFLGLAFGHFAIAGILWGLTGAWTGDAVKGYEVFFG